MYFYVLTINPVYALVSESMQQFSQQSSLLLVLVFNSTFLCKNKKKEEITLDSLNILKLLKHVQNNYVTTTIHIS